MAEGDGAATDVDAVEVGAQLLGPGQHDRGEGFVDLEAVDIVEGPAASR